MLNKLQIPLIIAGVLALWPCVLFVSAGKPIKENWKSYPDQKLPDKQINAIVEDLSGNIWIGSKNGLASMTPGETWSYFDAVARLEELGLDVKLGVTFYCMEVDRYGDIWMGTNFGLWIFSNGDWTAHTKESTGGGLPHMLVHSLWLNRETDEKWVGTENGFAKFHNSVWTTYSGEKIIGLLPDYKIFAIEAEEDGTVWLGTVAGLFKFNGSSYVNFTKENTKGGLPNNYITEIRKDRSGTLWVGTQEGLASYDGSKWMTYLPKTNPKMPGDVIYHISLGTGNDVWVGFKGGASRYRDGDWKLYNEFGIAKTYERDHGPPSYRVLSILARENGDVWFGTKEGACRLSPIK
jgi:ligand-binding sensor domain-containing protein